MQEKVANIGIGGAAVTMGFFDIANYAQGIGMIFGALIVAIQFYRIVRGILKGDKTDGSA